MANVREAITFVTLQTVAGLWLGNDTRAPAHWSRLSRNRNTRLEGLNIAAG
jgi:hypothetical protein